MSQIKISTLSPTRTYRVLIVDLVGLALGADGMPDISAVRDHIEAAGARFHMGPSSSATLLEAGYVHFFYAPRLRREAELLAETADGRYDAVIAAATVIPAGARFTGGGVRIGAGTGNMLSASWGGRDGRGGEAPLMNTPGINARATAQMVMKALLRRVPDLPLEHMHDLVVRGCFDTGRDLPRFPTAKLEGRTIGVLGYGNIGREVAKLAAAFGMMVRVHARPVHREWIESEGFVYAATPVAAADGADVLSVHIGLGPMDAARGAPANVGLIGSDVLAALNNGAMLINYDRGEVVDTAALDAALESGKVACAAIDADIFSDDAGTSLTGPLAPYVPLATRHGYKTLLLPHAAADTDHPSRVAGAKLAVDLILSALLDHKVYNLVGDLPTRYSDGGPRSPVGVGQVRPANLQSLIAHSKRLAELAEAARTVAAFYELLGDVSAGEAEILFDPSRTAAAIKAGNMLHARLAEFGLLGPYSNS